VVGPGHPGVELLSDLFDVPAVPVDVLDHLEVGDGDASGVAEEVGDDVDPLIVEDLIRLGGGGAVGELRDDLRLYPGGVLLGDDVLEGGDDQDVDVELHGAPRW